MYQQLNFLTCFVLLLSVAACDSQPKVIQAKATATAQTGISAESLPSFKEVAGTGTEVTAPKTDLHEVVIEEILNTDKYSYALVIEGERKYWIAISKRELNVGETYVYKGGLLKKNFFSKEFNRVFETVYLVSQFSEKQKPTQSTASAEPNIKAGASLPNLKVEKIAPKAGAISLSELFNNQEKYNSQSIKVTGKIMKVNPKIMGRNWLHLQDGTGKDLDLTITTTEKIPLGSIVTLEGTIALDKDFGAGYRYDLIMENAVISN